MSELITRATAPIVIPEGLDTDTETQTMLDVIDTRLDLLEQDLPVTHVRLCRLIASGECSKLVAFERVFGTEKKPSAVYAILKRPAVQALMQLLRRRWRIQSAVKAEDIVVSLMQLAEESRSKGDLKTARACLYDVSKIKGFATESVVNIQNNTVTNGETVTLNFNFAPKKPYGTLTEAEKREQEKDITPDIDPRDML